MTIKEFREKLEAAGFEQEFFSKETWTIKTKVPTVTMAIKIRGLFFDLTYRVQQPFSGHLISRHGVSLENSLETISTIINTGVNFDNGSN